MKIQTYISAATLGLSLLVGCTESKGMGDEASDETGGEDVHAPTSGGTPGSDSSTPPPESESESESASDSGTPSTYVPEASLCESPQMDDMGNLLFSALDANNYTFESSLTLDVTTVAPNSELQFDWSALDRSFVGHDVDPLADIDMVSLIVWNLSPEELAVKLNDDTLAMSDLQAVVVIYTENQLTSAGLYDFTTFGVPLEPEELMPYIDPEQLDPATHSYTFMAAQGTTPGEGTQMIASFRLDPETDNTLVEMTSESTILDFSADLSSLEPQRIPAGEADINLEWGNIAMNAMGQEFVARSIGEVMVAKYSLTPQELEEQFLDLELIADDIWRGEVTVGTDLTLSELTNDAGEAFTGIDDEGTWIVALVCSTCANPAPWYISILETCSQ